MFRDILPGVIDILLGDSALLPSRDVAVTVRVALHAAHVDDLLGQGQLVRFPGLYTGQDDSIGSELDPADGSCRQRLRLAGSFLAFGEVHMANRTLLVGLVPDDVRVHGAEVFHVAGGFLVPAKHGTRPLFPIRVQRAPTADYNSDNRQENEESQTGLERLQDLPGISPKAVLLRQVSSGKLFDFDA